MLRHAVVAQVLAVALLCAAITWQPGRTVLAQGATSGEEYVRVTVPPHARGGEMLEVAVAGRREREVAIPKGAQPGQELEFAIPAGRSPAALPKEQEVVDATRQAYRKAVATAKAASAPAPNAKPHAQSLQDAAPSDVAAEVGAEAPLATGTNATGDDFGPLIGAIKQIISASSSSDPDAAVKSQKALKDAVNDIVSAKIAAAREKDAAEAAEKKKEDDENIAKKLGRLLGEKQAEDEKVKEAQAAQKAAEEARAVAEAEAKKAEEAKSEENAAAAAANATAAESAEFSNATDTAEGMYRHTHISTHFLELYTGVRIPMTDQTIFTKTLGLRNGE